MLFIYYSFFFTPLLDVAQGETALVGNYRYRTGTMARKIGSQVTWAWLRDFTTRKAKKEKKGGKRKAEATKLLMLLSFIGTMLPSEEKDGLKVDEETKKSSK